MSRQSAFLLAACSFSGRARPVCSELSKERALAVFGIAKDKILLFLLPAYESDKPFTGAGLFAFVTKTRCNHFGKFTDLNGY
ncbi:hypothetical protein QFZ81_004486 [Paenibacillus sp. V4I9]|uniref:hypothetical protein n=1 Tax=Paenibacillus sp. V4I9 TaxID=3042308 RepID=UPI00278B8A15|nr:hypothetical protein [Paenibacillus sp. V4I9]MDQ0889398.1 hypothetical protein [Paenibacillus sp. V4I9]